MQSAVGQRACSRSLGARERAGLPTHLSVAQIQRKIVADCIVPAPEGTQTPQSPLEPEPFSRTEFPSEGAITR